MVFLYIILGMFAFIGALGLSVAFRDGFTELSTPKEVAVILSYIGAIGSTAPGFTSATKSPFVLVAAVVLVVAFPIALLKKSSKEISK